MKYFIGLCLQLVTLNICWCQHHRKCGSEPVITKIIDPGLHSEGPFWDVAEKVLYYVDIEAEFFNRYDPKTGRITRAKLPGGGVAFAIPVKGTNGRTFLVARGHDLLLLDWNHENAVFDTNSKNLTFITSVENGKGLEGNRWNEAKADVKGRLWAGTVGLDAAGVNVIENKAALYVLNPNSTEPVEQVGHVSVSNGLAWDINNTHMYYTDSRTAQVDVFDYDVKRGIVSNRRQLFNFKENNVTGHPDGIIIDNKGNLWITSFMGGVVVNLDPRTQTLIRTLHFPTSLVTSVTWGGPHLDILYVTTSRYGLSDEQVARQPLSGAVFTVSCLGVKAHEPAYYVVRS